MDTSTNHLVNKDSELFEQMPEDQKKKYEEVPAELKHFANQALGDQDETTIDNPANPLHQWARIRELDKKVEQLKNKVDRIFANHILVDGEWVDISKTEGLKYGDS